MAIVEELAYVTYLHEKGIPFEVILHAEVDDSLEKSDLLEVPTYGVLKAVLIKGKFGESSEALAVLPASRRINKKLITQVTGSPHIRLASEPEIDLEYRGFELGALPPAGDLLGIPTFVDATVFRHSEVIVSSGRTSESLMMRTKDLFRDQYVTAGLFSEALGEEDDPNGETT